jgi:hypothetical protein
MTTPPLPPSLQARSQEAQVAADEANARKAAADADMSALNLEQAKYKSLIPDLSKASSSSLSDQSAGVAYSGLVTYSALNHAAQMVADKISTLAGEQADGHPATILVTSQSDLLTNDLLAESVKTSLSQLSDFVDQVLGPPVPPEGQRGEGERPLIYTELASGIGPSIAAALAGGAGTAAFGPIGIAGAAVAAIPSIMSLFTSTTTVKDQTENITDLATTTSVVATVSAKYTNYTVLHEDFRFAPPMSILDRYQQLTNKRTSLIFRQQQVQADKNAAVLRLTRAEAHQDAAGLADEVDAATTASATADATLKLISATITSIDAFSTAVNATAAGSRSPLAIASLNEQLHAGGADGIGYVLSVKGLGGQSEEYTKQRRIGGNSFTTVADASISFMLYDTVAQRIVSSGVANGVSAVHGKLGGAPQVSHWPQI